MNKGVDWQVERNLPSFLCKPLQQLLPSGQTMCVEGESNRHGPDPHRSGTFV